MKKMKNPLIRRIPRELTGDWRKYLVISLFLILTIGFISGMYVANNSMLQAAENGIKDYKLEYGHFELNKKASPDLLQALEAGEQSDILSYYLDKAHNELDEKFEEEFKTEFTKEFDKEFSAQFEEEFKKQILQAMILQGISEKAAQSMLSDSLEQAKKDGSYKKAYRSAYKKAWKEAYSESYDSAYQEALEEIEKEVSDKYEDLADTYKLDSEQSAVPVTVYENFFRNEEEGTDSTVRVFRKTEDVNLACLMEGRFPEQADEIAIDRMHADNADISVGDTLQVGGKDFRVTGLLAYVNYSTLHEKNSDFMFDALKFDVAMVTDEGFDRLSSPIHYNYAWFYQKEPADEAEEKQLSDSYLKVLYTQSLTAEREIEEYIPRYTNSAVNFATEDMGSDMAMGGVLLYILIGIIAFIFAITCTNTISREASAIGTLRASGYTKGELTAHYLAMPVIITLVSAVIGNVLGYTVFVRTVTGMYYNSYSLPSYRTVWSSTAFIKTTLIPVVLMLIVNLAVILHTMQLSPLKFLRHDLKKRRQKKAMRLPRWSFFARFRLRIIFQNMPNYLVLFAGVFFVAVLLSMAVGMPSTLKHYQEHASEMMFADYQYILTGYEDEDGNTITTETEGAEPFSMHTLLLKNKALNEEISVYGIQKESQYVTLPGYDTLKENEVCISASFADKYDLTPGDSITLDEKYEEKQYTFTVAGIYEKSMSIAVFLPMDTFASVFDREADAFTGFLSYSEIQDLDEDSIATVITQRDITKMADQLDHSMGSYMTYFQYLCILLSAVLIYLLTKIIIEKNETAISMIKILGYEDREIFRLYLLSTTLVVLLADALSTILGSLFMAEAWKAIMSSYSGYFSFVMNPLDYLKIFGFIFLGYLIVLVVDFKRIRKIPLEEALKNVE